MSDQITAEELKLGRDGIELARQFKAIVMSKVEAEYVSDAYKPLVPSLYAGICITLLADTIILHCKPEERLQAIKDILSDLALYIDSEVTLDKFDLTLVPQT